MENVNIPNTLSGLRILATPFSIFFYLKGNFEAAFFVFFLAVLTDFFDGILARKLDQCTAFGSILDPVADKVFEMSFTLVMGVFGDLPWFYVVLLNVRNFAQLLSIPVLMWWKKIVFKVEPSILAKWGSALGMFVIGGVLLDKLLGFELMLNVLGLLVLISAAFEVYMLVTYLPRFWQIYHGKHDTFN